MVFEFLLRVFAMTLKNEGESRLQRRRWHPQYAFKREAISDPRSSSVGRSYVSAFLLKSFRFHEIGRLRSESGAYVSTLLVAACFSYRPQAKVNRSLVCILHEYTSGYDADDGTKLPG